MCSLLLFLNKACDFPDTGISDCGQIDLRHHQVSLSWQQRSSKRVNLTLRNNISKQKKAGKGLSGPSFEGFFSSKLNKRIDPK